jgi:Cu/Ag efflux protein CusF
MRIMDSRNVARLLGASVVAALVWSPLTIAAQKPLTQGAAVTETFVIDAIDHSNRMVTLKDSEGNTETIYCGPEVQRFDALKVGDKVTFRYYESVVYQIRKPGTAAAAPSAGAGVVRTPGTRPGGTISQQLTETVTVNAIDLKVPSVTITTSAGLKMSLKVEDPKNLHDVKAGDKVEITYTQALAISVRPPGK